MNAIFEMSKVGVIIVALLFLQGCVKTVDLPGNVFKKQVVVIGTPNPDSVLSVRLTYSLRPDTSAIYQAITNAEVLFLENGLVLGRVANAPKGVYLFNKKPLAGKTYSIRVSVPGFEEIYAEDSIPPAPRVISSKFAANPDNPNSSPDFEIRVTNYSLTPTPIWFGIYNTRKVRGVKPGSPLGEVTPDVFYEYLSTANLNILSNSPYLDRFNSFFDGLSGKYSFGDPARLDPVATTFDANPVIRYTILNQIKNDDQVFTYSFAASAGYDRYLKSSISAYQNRLLDASGALNNPFAEPTPVYSNIKNGLGIWGAYNAKRTVLQ